MNVVRRVAVQQQQRLLREGLRQLLEAEGDLEVVGATSSGDDLARLCEEERPELALMEADSVEWDPCRLAVRLVRRLPAIRLVGLYGRPLSDADRSALRAAGLTLVSRRQGSRPILEVLRAPLAAGRGRRDRTFSRSSWEERSETQGLTTREVEVLNLVGGGWTSREISGQLGISPKTVENHKQRMFAKLGVQNQAHAVSVAMRQGLIRPEALLDLAAGRHGDERSSRLASGGT
jgi:DNA-binding NarL/FixJ family response regulator